MSTRSPRRRRRTSRLRRVMTSATVRWIAAAIAYAGLAYSHLAEKGAPARAAPPLRLRIPDLVLT